MSAPTARLNGKVAIITGGARGMGAAHARAFVGHGARVVITDILRGEGEAVAGELGESCRFVEHDVADEAIWKQVVQEAEQAYGPVNVLVNNAGTAVYTPLEDTTEQAYRRVIDVNQIGVFLGMKTVAASMRRAGGGSIINVSSTAGITGPPLMVAYAGSKWAVLGMTKVCAKELGPHGIRVNAIHPGVIETPIFDSLPSSTTDALREMIKSAPLGRSAQPEEVTGLVVFLASEESGYITGGSHVIDGGMTP